MKAGACSSARLERRSYKTVVRWNISSIHKSKRAGSPRFKSWQAHYRKFRDLRIKKSLEIEKSRWERLKTEN